LSDSFFIVLVRGAKSRSNVITCLGTFSGGIVMTIILQALLNICVVTKVLPTKGWLCLYQLRRSSLLINLIAVGILLNISAQNEVEDKCA